MNSIGLFYKDHFFTLKSNKNVISLTISESGFIKKGSKKNSNLIGSKPKYVVKGYDYLYNDIFYGGKGNETISGVNGHDVVVYDKTAWGKDVIAATSGSITLLFNGLKSKDITQKKSGKNLIITRKSDKKQQITVKNYTTSTHNIVYASGMTAFNKYISQSKPTTAQTNNARNEVFKKAGIAQA